MKNQLTNIIWNNKNQDYVYSCVYIVNIRTVPKYEELCSMYLCMKLDLIKICLKDM